MTNEFNDQESLPSPSRSERNVPVARTETNSTMIFTDPDEAREVEEALRGWIRKANEVFTRARNGDLEARILGIPEDPDIRAFANSVNGTLDIIDAFVRESGASLTYASEGKFFRRVLLKGLPGSFRSAASLINAGTEEM